MRKWIAVLTLIVLAAAVPVSAQSASKGIIPSPGTIRGFDPQPDPPAAYNGAPTTGLEKVGFNPQPDPPRVAFGDGSV